jgi:hypothetical protein
MNRLKDEHGQERPQLNRRTFVSLTGSTGVALVLGGGSSGAAVTSERNADHPVKMAWRVHRGTYFTDAAFAQLLAIFTRYRSAVDEVCLFETPTHQLYLTPEWMAETAEVIGRRLNAFRAAGIRSVGINLLTTLGHGDEAWDVMPELPFPAIVGHDGTKARGSACPNQAAFRAYIRLKYALFAQAKPDFIWVDDDLRMQSHGIAWGCFCAECLRLFAAATGRNYDREALVSALDESENSTLRRAWVEHNGRVLESLLADIAAAVREVDASIALGLMTLGPAYSAYNDSAFERWFKTLGGIKGRPGQGFYWETTPGRGFPALTADRMGLIDKAFEMSRQNLQYPPQVVDRQAEYEAYPYGSLLKSPQGTVNECAMAIMAGCNGIAFNLLGMWGSPLEEFHPFFQKLNDTKETLSTMLRHADGLPARGLWSAWSPQMMGRRKVSQGESWFKSEVAYDTSLANVLAQIGVPLSAERNGLGTVLTGRIAEAFDDAELESILAEGVMLDSIALRVLSERGLGELTGVRIKSSYDNGVIARLTDDPLNGRYAGAVDDVRDMVPEEFKQADVLEPLKPTVRVLAQLQDFLLRDKGPCMTAYENALGGRVVVVGHAPWWFLHSAHRRFQTLEAADWIAKRRLPLRIEETVAIAPMVRADTGGTRGLIMLLNTGLGPVDSATLHLRMPESTPVRLASTVKGPHMSRFNAPRGWGVRIENMPAWSTLALLFGKER